MKLVGSGFLLEISQLANLPRILANCYIEVNIMDREINSSDYSKYCEEAKEAIYVVRLNFDLISGSD